MTNRARLAPLALLAAAGLATLAAPAWSQDQQPPTRRAQQDGRAQQARPVLSGPSVREQRVPGTESGFSEGAESMRPRMAQAVPAPVFRKALGGLMAEDAPLEIRLSPEQRERIIAHVRDFERRSREQLGDERRERPNARPGVTDRAPNRPASRPQPDRAGERRQADRPQQDRPGADRPQTDRRPNGRPQGDRPQTDQGSTNAPPAPRGESRRHAALALAGLQHHIWAELSAAQQAHVGKAIEAWRAKAAQEQLDRTQERYRMEIEARFDEMEGKPAQRDRGDRANAGRGTSELRQWFSTLPEETRTRLRERLGAMPAERREALLARVADMSAEQRAGLVRRLLQSKDRVSQPKRPQ